MSETTMNDRHPDDDLLILHHYGEPEAAWVGEHLAVCERCRSAAGRLARVLDRVELPEPPGPDEMAVTRIRRNVALAVARRETRPSWWSWPRLSLAAAAAAVLVAAFVAGRMTGPAGTPLDAQVRERARLAAVADHLDRSRRTLVELTNAPAAGPEDAAAERIRAAELLAFNRLHRSFAERAGDEAVARLLDDLERVLLDAANAGEFDTAEVLELQRRITRQDLLYRMRMAEETARSRSVPPPRGRPNV